MQTKSLIGLAVTAVVLGGAAYWLGSGAKIAPAKLNGKKVVPAFNVSDVARIEVGSKLKIVASADGWKVETYHGYPADRTKIADNLMKLTELKVGQVARGKKLASTTPIALKDATGKELVALQLGERHAKYGHGRYMTYQDQTVLVSDTLDAFEGDAKQWIETKIVDDPWISFNEIADAKLTEADLGFATGIVAKVTIAGDTNRTMTVGNPVKGGNGRYIKLDGNNWVFEVPEYSVDKFLPKPPPPEKKADEKKAEPAKTADKADKKAEKK